MTLREKIKSINLKIFYQDKYFLVNLAVGLLLNLAAWILLYLQFKPQVDPIILHYNIYFGIDLIGPWYRVYLMSGLGLLVFFINFLLSVIIYVKEKVLSYFLIHVSTLVQILILLASIFIIYQNL